MKNIRIFIYLFFFFFFFFFFFSFLVVKFSVYLNRVVFVMKTGIYRGIYYFSYFCLWVLASTHNLCFEQKYEKYQSLFYLKIFSFSR